MPLTGMLACAALALVVGCEMQEYESLKARCQFKECVCAAPQTTFPGTVETAGVLWRDSGEPYCAEGYVLRSPEQLNVRRVSEQRRAFRETR